MQNWASVRWKVSKVQHDHDIKDILSTSSTETYDWEVISLFYSVMHLMDIYIFELRSIKFKNHAERNSFVARELPREVSKRYISFYSLSREARYILEMSDKDKSKAEQYYAFLRSHLTTLIKTPLS